MERDNQTATAGMIDRIAHALMLVTSEVDCGDLKLKHHYEMARAAIAAMREQTDAPEVGTTAAGRFYCHVCRDEKPNQEIERLRVAIRKALAALERDEPAAARSILREKA